MLAGEARFVVDGKEMQAGAGRHAGRAQRPAAHIPGDVRRRRALADLDGPRRFRTDGAHGRAAGQERRIAADQRAIQPGKQIEVLAAVCRENRIELIGPPLA